MSIELSSKRVTVRSRRRKNLNGISLRQFRYDDSDYAAIAHIESLNYPDSPISAGEYRFYDETRDKQYLFERFVAEQNGRVLGHVTYGQPWWSFEEGKYFFDAKVHPDWQDSNLAAALVKAVFEKLETHQPRHLVSHSREDQQYITKLLCSLGFEPVMRFPLSDLDVQQFDAARFAAVCDRVRDGGIRVDNLAIIDAEDGDWKRKLWNLERELLQDVPTPEPLTPMTFELWQKRVLESPNFRMDAQTIAREGERFVGMSGLWTSETSPEKLYTGLTGVVRSHRRRGFATAMKVKGIQFAQARGIKVIETENEENNPMLDLNKQLGFREKPAFVSYEKKLELKEPEKELLKVPL